MRRIFITHYKLHKEPQKLENNLFESAAIRRFSVTQLHHFTSSKTKLNLSLPGNN